MKIIAARDSVFAGARGPRYEYGSCPTCDAEIDEPCTDTRPGKKFGDPIGRVHPEREKKPIGGKPQDSIDNIEYR